jgi:leucyl-tRNA synthetase
VHSQVKVMAERYDPRSIEPKWQARWEERGQHHTPQHSTLPCWYALTMFPYPSGDLHVGHWYAIAPSDAKARFMRRRGYNVLFPIGFDAFGLPAENAAIKRGVHPHRWTQANMAKMRTQLRAMGAMFDWRREVVTCEPDYYRWTQWFFLQLYKGGLAYKARAAAWWCSSCQTVLANEQVVGENNECERCGTLVVKRDLDQWFFRITRYAEELLRFDGLEWPERVQVMQRNWIGKSEGVQFRMRVRGTDHRFEVFTTRPDTIYGMTFAVLAPEHPLVAEVTAPERRDEVEAYVAQARRASELERMSAARVRTGVPTGAFAEHPLTGAPVPIYVADYVLWGYGTGAIMAVPGHDERDFDFARRYGLPIPVVIAPPGWDGEPLEAAYAGEGTMVGSGDFDGLPSAEGWERIADRLQSLGAGERRVNYRLRDWLISRQRYWGAPIPMVYCDACGTVPVPEEDLPVLLPPDAQFRPDGVSPLTYHEGFLHTRCPACGGLARRETDTMDTFVDSSWYFLRYLSPKFERGPYDKADSAEWLPVHQYTGGIEHACMHLLYARFFVKACRDLGIVDVGEPFTRLFNQGMILGEDNEKMSKSRGNVVDPDALVSEIGADAVRLFLMFIGPWELGGPWNSRGIEGVNRFLQRVWAVVREPNRRDAPPLTEEGARDLRRQVHKTVRQVTGDFERFAFNTALARLMELTNALMKSSAGGLADAYREAQRVLVSLLAPMAPHMAEELWEALGETESVHLAPWPAYDEALARDDVITLVVQVNGKVRDKLEAPAGIDEAAAREIALASERVRQALQDKAIRKAIYVPGRLLNLVVG